MNDKRKAILLAWLPAIAVLCMIPKLAYNDPDTFWHIELGRYMLHHGTVLHHAIHAYSGDRLPYVPHEFGFQLAIAGLYESLGWPGIFLLAAASMGLLLTGLYRLAEVSRREQGLDRSPPPTVVVFILVVAVCVYYYYFTSRPQMVSAGLIVWFFVQLREYRLRDSAGVAAWLPLLSILLANVHAGVWPVVAVFTVMAMLEDLAERRISVRRLAVFASVFVAGFLNVGGWRSLFFILTVTRHHFNALIDEWNPIAFTTLENAPRLLALLLLAVMLPHALHRRLFRYLVLLGVLYLGVSSYKMNLFLWLLLPYFAATAVEALPRLPFSRLKLSRRRMAGALAVGLLLQAAAAFVIPTRIDPKSYPVEEMAYILRQSDGGQRPKVMASYGSSGYVMFAGGDVLADGRQDPFITDASRGAYGWTAFERSMYGFSERLPEIVRSDRPDYVIARARISELLLADWTKRYGEPVFAGKYGSVFRIAPAAADPNASPRS